MANLLQDKVVLVTGAGHPRGIGRAILNALIAEGATVIGCDSLGAEGLSDIDGLACDVTDKTMVKAMVETMRQQIIHHIHSQAVDPKTKSPHPKTRIELALEESRYSVDPFKRLEEQVKDAINKLKPLIPLSFETVRLAFKVSGGAYGSVSQTLRSYRQKEGWLEDGSWACVIECPAGMKAELIGQVMRRDSNAEVKELGA